MCRWCDWYGGICWNLDKPGNYSITQNGSPYNKCSRIFCLNFSSLLNMYNWNWRASKLAISSLDVIRDDSFKSGRKTIYWKSPSVRIILSNIYPSYSYVNMSGLFEHKSSNVQSHCTFLIDLMVRLIYSKSFSQLS